jgi:hypothetical protein
MRQHRGHREVDSARGVLVHLGELRAAGIVVHHRVADVASEPQLTGLVT